MKINWRAILPYVLGFSTASTGSMVAVQQGWFGGEMQAPPLEMRAAPAVKAAPKVEAVATDSLEEEEEDYRSSADENERATQYKRVQKPPKNGMRVGCICMDYIDQEVTGTGACAGHGGVRFWLYQLADASIVEYPTRTHNEHPDALNADEIKNLRLGGKKKVSESVFGLGFFELLFGMMFCITIAYIVRVWFAPASNTNP
jgi:hypothetical protein